MRKKSILHTVKILAVLAVAVFAIGVGIYGYREIKKISGAIENLEQEKGKLDEQVARLAEENTVLEERNTLLKYEMDQAKKEAEEMERKLKAEARQRKKALAEQKEREAALSIAELSPGTILEKDAVLSHTEDFFKAEDIAEGGEIYNRINGKSYRANENIGLSELTYLKMVHYNFDHQIQVGEMIVNKSICEDVMQIFKELFAQEYEIQSMYLVDNYWTGDGDSTDTASIEVNNTSAFNYREVTGGGSLSRHAYGCAIDINPQQNPYVWYDGGQLRWSHANADPYIDRYSGNPHVIVEGDICCSLFKKYGFGWGGNWSNPIDYQHFERR